MGIRTLDEKGLSKWHKPIRYVINENGCWECISHKPNPNGYILVNRNGKRGHLHRFSYETYKGKIPAGLVIIHSCDNPSCFNPNHLSVGTMMDNMQDKISKNRQSRGESGGTSKLSNDKVREIYLDNRTFREIAKDFEISIGTINQIKTRKTWKEVTNSLQDCKQVNN
jgi:hypothetical protein